jgi:N-methylhydantoinase A
LTRLGIDVGGTFTDLVAIAADGAVHVRKVASTPEDPAAGFLKALDGYLGKGEGGRGKGKAQPSVEVLVHGTTVATNALLERRGARVVLVTTAGFEDLLWLRRQDRAALYDLACDHPPPVVAREDVVGVVERIGPEGVVTPLGRAEVERVVTGVRARAPEAVAVACLFAFRHPEHEQALARALCAALPGIPVVASHEVLPVFREYERTSTTAAEAYLRPRVAAYLARLAAEAPRRGAESLRIMSSSGGTLDPRQAATRAATLALSGPAGGVIGAGLVARAVGLPNALTLDMGGTSADASLLLGGEALAEATGSVGGVPLALPAVLIETVGAGGGSIAGLDAGGALRVGPESAGAVPGPACYGRGGTAPTVTDACLALGWLDRSHPLADAVRLDTEAAEQALEPLGRALQARGHAPGFPGLTQAATGIVEVVTAVMARALKRVSVARGVDPRRLALIPFGGAGPLFGCALADALGMATVVVPPHPGVLSALGLAAAAERLDLVASFHRALAGLDAAALAAGYAPLVERAGTALPGAATSRLADCRFAGQGYEVSVPVTSDDPAAIGGAFLAAHRARYGHADASLPVEIVNLRVVAARAAALPALAEPTGAHPKPQRREIIVGGARMPAAVWPLGALAAGRVIAGPAILAGVDATGLVEPGWRGVVHASGAVILERAA